MLPPQCPMVSHISHSTALSAEPAVTALSTFGDILREVFNQAAEWTGDTASADNQVMRQGHGAITLTTAIGLSVAIAGVWNLGKLVWREHRIAQVRANLAQELERRPQPQRVLQRRNAIDEHGIGVNDPRELRFLAEMGLTSPTRVEPLQTASLSSRQQGVIFALGSRHGYLEGMRAAEPTSTPVGRSVSDLPPEDVSSVDNTPWDESIDTLERRFPEGVRNQIRALYQSGFDTGRQAAEQWDSTPHPIGSGQGAMAEG